ncbi:MAG: phage integrase N-terminal SAM-like domain-containing protein [Methylobacteriaceae bacterium]|nr:phage integrase N-terminal SAM-like domain-containing protein [Methylobacteriaceae bacterium]
MLFRLVRPMLRSGSSQRQFVKRIPDAVRHALIGRRLLIPFGPGLAARVHIGPATRSIRFSLRTRDAAEAKARQAEALAFIEPLFASAANGTAMQLSHRQAVALSGRLYRSWSSEEGERTVSVEVTPEGTWKRVLPSLHELARAFRQQADRMAELVQSDDDAGLESAFGPVLNTLLDAEGIANLDHDSRVLAMRECARAASDAFKARARNAKGNYAPDPKAQRFPALDPQRDAAQSAVVALSGLFERWHAAAKAAKRKESTIQSYRATIAKFVAFIGHDDAARVTTQNVIDFRDARLRESIAPKTVKGSDINALRVVFGWAVDNKQLPANPALGVKVMMPRRAESRRRKSGYSDEEAVSLLSACLRVDTKGRASKRRLAERWVPWIQAYTGARVGEIAQLRKHDVRREDGQWVIRITPEAGTVKTGEERLVVLHPHLVESGFPDVVAAAPEGHLFLKPARTGYVLGPLRGLKNRLAEFARRIVPDPRLAPTHSWRDRFRTIARRAGIEDSIVDAIQGHAPPTEGRRYGSTEIAAQARAFQLFPRVQLPGAS